MALPTLMAFADIPGFGVLATEMRAVLGKQPLVTPKQASRTKISSQPQAGNLSSGVKLAAIESNCI